MERLTMYKTWRYDHFSVGIYVAHFLMQGYRRKTLRKSHGFVELRWDHNNSDVVLITPFFVCSFYRTKSRGMVFRCHVLLLCVCRGLNHDYGNNDEGENCEPVISQTFEHSFLLCPSLESRHAKSGETSTTDQDAARKLRPL